MNLNSLETKFAKCSSIDIPDTFFNRMTTGCSEIDLMFGTEYLSGFMAGSAITICGTPGSGKCHAGDQILEIFADDDIIEDIKIFLATKTIT